MLRDAHSRRTLRMRSVKLGQRVSKACFVALSGMRLRVTLASPERDPPPLLVARSLSKLHAVPGRLREARPRLCNIVFKLNFVK